MQRYAIVFFIVLEFLTSIFAEESFSDKKMQELAEFLNEHQEDLQRAERLDDELFEVEERLYDELSESEATSRLLSALLDDQEMPVMLKVYYFLLTCFSPELWGDITTSEEAAQIYLKFLKHSNPIVRLHGLNMLQEIK
jgi:hypothetical protein